MLSRLSVFYLFIFCFSCFKLSAQGFDEVASGIAAHGTTNQRTNIFVHFDKNIYTNNDQVWFTAYLLDHVVSLEDYHTLYLALIHNRDSTVVMQKRFLIEDGFSFGNFILPDSLLSGDYRFVVNTNIKKNDQFEMSFVQPISIKSNTVNSLMPHFSLVGNNDQSTKSSAVLLKVLTGDNRFVENAEVSYTIGRQQIIDRGLAKTSVIGEVLIPYPKSRIDSSNNVLSVSIKKNNEIRNVQYDLPNALKKAYNVSFYPEGGYLVEGLLSNVGFEIRDSENRQIQSKGVLYENDIPIDTLQSDIVGLGIFKIVPKSGGIYYFKLAGQNDQFQLPMHLKKGIVMHADDVIANEDFRLSLQSSDNTRIHAIVHDHQGKLSLHSEMQLKKGISRKVRFNLDSVAIGLNTVTILDSAYQPLAERIFFAHHNQLIPLQLHTDKQIYKKRDSVQLAIEFGTNDLENRSGLVSISCVQANRYSLSNNKNIVDYALLDFYLSYLPLNTTGIKTQNKDYLNKILLIRGWRRYQWQNISSKQPSIFSSAELSGQVFKGKNRIEKPMELNTIAKSNIHSIVTDSVGKFEIPFSNLLIDDKTDVWLSIKAKNPSIFSVKLNEPLNAIKNELQHTSYKSINSQSSSLINDFSINSQSGIKLKEVVITKKKDNFSNDAFSERPRINRCGDYVCVNNILNCINHGGDPGNRPPKPNSYYRNQEGAPVTYFGCPIKDMNANISLIKGIQLAKDFYKYDIKNLDEPINNPTIYWNYQEKLNSGRAKVSFTTGDLTGEFKIIVQGITQKSLLYAEKYINIK